MKPTDLQKQQGKKTVGAMKREPTPERYGANSAAPADRRDQREKDKAAGLVPFAIKLPQELVGSLQALAQSRGVSLNEVAADLLRKGMAKK
ncbi:hypothetical protein BURK1_03680 [Burkholderiales bacterium]|nr:hypothetical protein BURK1_03680 [Burkholderiales bacterium]